jgi:hypothetical protein
MIVLFKINQLITNQTPRRDRRMIYLKMLGAMLCTLSISYTLDMSLGNQIALHVGILLIVLTGGSNNG